MVSSMYHNVSRRRCYDLRVARRRFDPEDLDPIDPFELDGPRIHWFKHEGMDPDLIPEIWTDNPKFIPARDDGPADWLMVGEAAGDLVAIPLAASELGPSKARPIGIYLVPRGSKVDTQYWEQ